MLDLFNQDPQMPNVQKKEYYKAKDGKFTSKEKAYTQAVEKERDKYKTNYHFYKRQAERLVQEVNQEKQRADMLQAYVNQLSKSRN